MSSYVTPMSLTRMAFSGNALSISCAARWGWMGVLSSVRPGAMKRSIVGCSLVVSSYSRELAEASDIGRASLRQELPQEGTHIRHQAERDG
jgi:hypothetical protein